MEEGREDGLQIKAACLSSLIFVIKACHLACIAEKSFSDIWRKKAIKKMQYKGDVDIPGGGGGQG